MAHKALGQDEEAIVLLADYLRGDPNNLEAAGLLAEGMSAQGDKQRANLLLQYSAAKLGVHSTIQ